MISDKYANLHVVSVKFRKPHTYFIQEWYKVAISVIVFYDYYEKLKILWWFLEKLTNLLLDRIGIDLYICSFWRRSDIMIDIDTMDVA